MAVTTSPSRAAQRPWNSVSGPCPSSTGGGTSNRAVNVPLTGSKARAASVKSSQRPVRGYQALYTDSLALNSTRSQWIRG